MKAIKNAYGRIECNGTEFTSGDVVEVLIDDKWMETRIEHNGRDYYSIHNYQLIGNEVRYPHLK
ncbi:DUF5348 domain-containing protein [Acinetobacter baumannii]